MKGIQIFATKPDKLFSMSTEFSKILLERYQSGDSQAASEIHARYARRLLGLAKSKLLTLLSSKVDPADIAQETFLAFFEMADRDEVRWDREGDLWRLIAGIAINQMHRQTEFFAAAKRNVGQEVAQSEIPIVDEKNDVVAISQLEDLVSVVLQNEKPLAKKVLTARLAGLTHVEIAERTGRSERTIRRVLQTLKSKLANCYDFQIGDDEPADREALLGSHDNIGISFDHFDLVRMIGAGAFGKVYLARDHRTGESVAIKVLKSSWLGRTGVESQFLNEANQLARLSHPNIVGFLGAGPLPNGSWFIVMENCVGQSLRNFDFKSEEMSFALKRMREIALAIAYLHEKGVVHGDLQPANVMLTSCGAKLIDFGFSCFQMNDSSRRARLVGGAEGFIAPELNTSREADVYSLGKLIEFVLDRVGDAASENEIAKLRHVAKMACDFHPKNRPDANQLVDLIAEASL